MDLASSDRSARSPAGSRPAAPPGRTASSLLLVADETADDELLNALEGQGAAVALVRDGARALIEIGRLAPAALILAARLPVVDGVTVVRAVRDGGGCDDMPILLAVEPDDHHAAAAGLAAGASACVGKPYRVNEVLALIGVARPGGPGAPDGAVLRAGAVSLDAAAHEVRLAGEPVRLPPQEFRLLQVLLEHAGVVVTREALLERVWGDPATETNTLAVHVRRLRRRLGDAGETARLIESVRGVGYRFRIPEPGGPAGSPGGGPGGELSAQARHP
jgi:DNA-binding response OmpR family regulator